MGGVGLEGASAAASGLPSAERPSRSQPSLLLPWLPGVEQIFGKNVCQRFR